MASVTIILPKECIGSEEECKIVTYCHPRTGRPAKCVLCKDQIYELTVVDGSNPHTKSPGPYQKALNEARCIFYTSGKMLKDASVLVATPINGLFFVLQLLYTNRNRYLTVDNLQDLLEDRVHDVTAQDLKVNRSISIAFLQAPCAAVYERYLELVCTTKDLGSGCRGYQLNEASTVSYLNKIRDRMLENEKMLPPVMVKKFVTDLIAPVDVTADAPPAMRAAALQQLTMFLISTYLSDDITNLYFKSANFEQYEDYITKLVEAKEKSQSAQRALSEQSGLANTNNANMPADKRRGLPLGPQKAKKAKSLPVAPKNNRSIMDMFKTKKS